jgi:hypothetical protein
MFLSSDAIGGESLLWESGDGGRTWSPPTKTPFPALANNQRPTVVRLASGRIFFASAYQARKRQATERRHWERLLRRALRR